LNKKEGSCCLAAVVVVAVVADGRLADFEPAPADPQRGAADRSFRHLAVAVVVVAAADNGGRGFDFAGSSDAAAAVVAAVATVAAAAEVVEAVEVAVAAVAAAVGAQSFLVGAAG
jgi:hypothetical protein